MIMINNNVKNNINNKKESGNGATSGSINSHNVTKRIRTIGLHPSNDGNKMIPHFNYRQHKNLIMLLLVNRRYRRTMPFQWFFYHYPVQDANDVGDNMLYELRMIFLWIKSMIIYKSIYVCMCIIMKLSRRLIVIGWKL